jgi:hypothetical protein
MSGNKIKAICMCTNLFEGKVLKKKKKLSRQILSDSFFYANEKKRKKRNFSSKKTFFWSQILFKHFFSKLFKLRDRFYTIEIVVFCKL